MADPTTWIDVADTAVKVGLGALIGGGISYFLSRLDHERESKKEYIKRRMDKLEEAFSEIDQFTQSVSLYWANLANGVFKQTKNTLTDEDEASLSDEEQELFNKYSILNSARTKLVLLSEKETVKVLDEFRETSDNFFKIANLGNKNCTKYNLYTHKDKIMKSRQKLFEKLSDSYSKNT